MADDLKIKMGRNIRNLRENRGLTQEALAEKLGISQRSVSKIETGVTHISYTNLEKLGEILNIPIKLVFDFRNFEHTLSEAKIKGYIIEELNKIEAQDLKKLKVIVETFSNV